MRCLTAIVLLAALATPLRAESVPSGRALVLWEVLFERVQGSDGAQMVLRYIAPSVAGAEYDAVASDLDWLCTRHGIAMAALDYVRADSIVITLMDRPVPRGRTDPEATQFFEIYRIADAACLAEEY